MTFLWLYHIWWVAVYHEVGHNNTAYNSENSNQGLVMTGKEERGRNELQQGNWRKDEERKIRETVSKIQVYEDNIITTNVHPLL